MQRRGAYSTCYSVYEGLGNGKQGIQMQIQSSGPRILTSSNALTGHHTSQ